MQGDFEGTGFIVENVLEYDFHAYNELNNSIKLSKIQELFQDENKLLNALMNEKYAGWDLAKIIEIMKNSNDEIIFDDIIGSTSLYTNNINFFQENGLSYELYLKKCGINVARYQTKLEVAEALGDSKLYLFSLIESILFDPYADIYDQDWRNLRKKYEEYSEKSIADINVEEFFNDTEEFLIQFLDQSDIDKWKTIHTGSQKIQSSTYSNNQLSAIFNYTLCGGFEINAWLNDTYLPESNVKARVRYVDIATIQNAISGLEFDSIGTYTRANRVFKSSDGSIIEELDSAISSTNYDDAIVCYRGIRELFNKNIKIDPFDLKIGDKFTSAGFQSSSILRENCYACNGRHDDVNIMLEIIVPPNSGTAAFIENVSGVASYGQMEVLIKRNAEISV